MEQLEANSPWYDALLLWLRSAGGVIIDAPIREIREKKEQGRPS